MPELPEVETIQNHLKRSYVLNSEIVDITIVKKKCIKNISPEEFTERLKGQKIEEIKRKGKWLFFFLNSFVMIIHLRMTGKFFFVKEENNTSFVFSLLFKNQKNLYFYDNRGFSVVLLQKKDIFKELYPYKDIGLDVLLDEIPEQIFQEKKNEHKSFFIRSKKNKRDWKYIFFRDFVCC